MSQDLSIYEFRPSPRFMALCVLAIAAVAVFGLARGVIDAGGLSLPHLPSRPEAADENRLAEPKAVSLPTSSVFTPPVVASVTPAPTAAAPLVKTDQPVVAGAKPALKDVAPPVSVLGNAAAPPEPAPKTAAPKVETPPVEAPPPPATATVGVY
jgi:hypothetical protein